MKGFTTQGLGRGSFHFSWRETPWFLLFYIHVREKTPLKGFWFFYLLEIKPIRTVNSSTLTLADMNIFK